MLRMPNALRIITLYNKHVGPMVGAGEADVQAGASEPDEQRAEGGINVELEEYGGSHCACVGGSGREGRLRRTGILEGERKGGREGNAQGIGGRIKWARGSHLLPYPELRELDWDAGLLPGRRCIQ